MKTETTFNLLKKLWFHIGIRRQSQLAFVTILMFIASIAEVVSIGAVIPFLSVLVNPRIVFEHDFGQLFVTFLSIQSPSQLIFPITLLFVFFVILSGFIRLSLLWIVTKLSFAIGADISFSIFQKTLYQPYSIHCSRNSSEVINGVFNKTNIVINSVVVSLVMLLSTSIMLTTILLTLFFIEPAIALATFGGFGTIYLLIVGSTKKKLYLNSIKEAQESTNVIKALQEGLGGIRDVLINGTQDFFSKLYRSADLPLRQAQGTNLFISTFPRYGVETFGTILICGIAFILAKKGGGIESAVPVLGVVALGAQRLLPILQQAYLSWSQIRGARASLEDTILLLDQSTPSYLKSANNKLLKFESHIELDNIDFKYEDKKSFTLKKFCLKINKGSRIGLVGLTGSGKSTLIDIIMGLHQPTKGSLKVDGKKINLANTRSWQNNIAHVPQSIYLADTSISENIAFGVPKTKINMKRVLLAAKKAQIAETIENLPERYDTLVGENGIRLSGGQKQRIGIARALYRDSKIIIFDEATSSLDNKTEKAVMKSLEDLERNITLIIIAHRVTTLKNCDQIVELTEGGNARVGLYSDILL